MKPADWSTITNGFTVWYEADGDVVGVLTLNADDDHQRAYELLRAG